MAPRKTQSGIPLWASASVLCLAAALLPPPPNAQAATPDAGGAGEPAQDCTTAMSLSRAGQSVVRYVVWCGTQPGRVTLKIRRPKDPRPLGFPRIAKATGPGAAGSIGCRRQPGGRIFCEGRKRGPITIRGTVTVPPGTRCGTPISLDVPGYTGGLLSTPAGCRNAYTSRVRPIREIVNSRADEGLDLDLAGDREAILRRAKQLQRAWLRGEPVARWTSEEEAWGMPLFAHEQVEMEYRDEYRERFQDLVEEGDWVAKNAPSSWAGYALDDAAGGIIYVGFTVEPEATLEKLKALLIAPDRFRPFPVPPRYTEKQLWRFEESLLSAKGPLYRLINMIGVDYLANKVEVGTENIARVKRLLAERYGPGAPFKVVYASPIELL